MVFLEKTYMPLQNCIEANFSSKTSWSRIWDQFVSEFFCQVTILSSWISLLLWRMLQQLSYSLVWQTLPPHPLSPDLVWIPGLRRLQALDPRWEGRMDGWDMEATLNQDLCSGEEWCLGKPPDLMSYTETCRLSCVLSLLWGFPAVWVFTFPYLFWSQIAAKCECEIG